MRGDLYSIEEGVLVLQQGACILWQGLQITALLPILLQAEQGGGVAGLIEPVIQLPHLHTVQSSINQSID